jgi:hypothetical protein
MTQTQTDSPSRAMAPAAPAIQHRYHPRIAGRDALYWFECPACIAADEARRNATAPQISDADLSRTFFLVPDYTPEREVCVEYLKRTYPRTKNLGSEVNLQALPYVTGAQIVVVCRRPRPGQELAPTFKLELMQDQKWKEVKQPIVSMLGDVLESAPIGVADSIAVSQPSVFVPSTVSTDELVDRLCEVCPTYRMFRQNAPDCMIRFMQQS